MLNCQSHESTLLMEMQNTVFVEENIVYISVKY